MMNMPSFYIIDLVEILVSFYGNVETEIDIVGIREGEKLHEVLISEHEVPRTDYVNEDYYVIYPQLKTGRCYYHDWNQEDKIWDGKGDTRLKHALTSKDNLKDKDYLTKLLRKEAGYEL